LSDDEAVHLLRYAKDRGINFFDTSDDFENGRGESVLAAAFSDEREHVVFATKFSYNFYHSWQHVPGSSAPQDFSPKYIRFACEESMKRLHTDHIDLYQIRNPGIAAVEDDAVYAALEKLKKQGKILHWAVCFDSGIPVEEAKLLMRLRKTRAIQLTFNLMDQEPARDVLDEGLKRHTGFIVRGACPAGLGHATEKEKFKFLERENERTLAQTALKFVLSERSVVSALAPITNERELNEFVLTSECRDLTAEEIRKIADLYESHLESEPPRKRELQR